MARRRDAATAAAAVGQVPIELTDKGHSTWRSAEKFYRWCDRHGLTPPEHLDRNYSTWAVKFAWSSTAWGAANDLGVQELRLLGVPPCGALDRARARSEADAR